jgi:xanthine dehydrogenase molybdopterin-binding subunit B
MCVCVCVRQIMKLGALKQCAGEALYTYDEKQDRDGFYGALAITSVALGTITAIDTSAALGMSRAPTLCTAVFSQLLFRCVRAAMPGVVRVLTKADIPTKGSNTIFGGETMFLGVGDAAICIGQSVALVLADTFQHAYAASLAVNVTYTTSTPPIVTISVCAAVWACL